MQDARAYDLAQTIRRSSPDAWAALSAEQLDTAVDLAAIAAQQRLVPFMGAGISVSAGAPTWQGLIRDLATTAGLSEQEATSLATRHDVLDQAAYLYHEFQRVHPNGNDAFARAVVQAVERERYGLAPVLLAALEAEQAITLNYDTLFERAARDAGVDRRVIPGGQSTGDRWLLKLHGTVDKPSSIVLTRDHYLGFSADRDALTALAKATLMTRRLLFVGFGMSDSHFHEIAHHVRRALPERGHVFGTVLLLTDDPVTRRLWEGDLEFVVLGTGRRLEIFLDAVMAHATDAHSYVLAHGYAVKLPENDAALREAVLAMASTLDEAKSSSAWPVLHEALKELGWDEHASSRSSSVDDPPGGTNARRLSDGAQ